MILLCCELFDVFWLCFISMSFSSLRRLLNCLTFLWTCVMWLVLTNRFTTTYSLPSFWKIFWRINRLESRSNLWLWRLWIWPRKWLFLFDWSCLINLSVIILFHNNLFIWFMIIPLSWSDQLHWIIINLLCQLILLFSRMWLLSSLLIMGNNQLLWCCHQFLF